MKLVSLEITNKDRYAKSLSDRYEAKATIRTEVGDVEVKDFPFPAEIAAQFAKAAEDAIMAKLFAEHKPDVRGAE